MRARGFTLLEVLIAMAILAVSLVVIMRVMDQAALVTAYQDQQITAASLARRKMVDLELMLEKDGFPTDEKEECGSFTEDLADEIDQPNGNEGFEYCWTLKKVELPIPMDMLGSGEGSGSGGSGSGSSTRAGRGSTQNPLASGFGGLSPEAVGEQLGKAVRVLTLTVKWKTGQVPQEFTVTTHFVNVTQAQIF